MGCVSAVPRGGSKVKLDDNEFTFVSRDPNHIVDDFWKYFVAGREMGTGASCRVLKVHNKEEAKKSGVKKYYACKEMVRDDEWNPRLFQTEYDILSLLNHPNVLKYVDAWIDRKNFYVLNELCTGGELFERIHKERKFSERKAAKILTDIISAIHFCHEQNVVHRDLKPENIVYRVDDDGTDQLVIIDFGDAKIVQDTEMYNEFVGTAFYLPPEIIRDRKGWELKMSDMWSIGIIAYVLMTGRPPFHGKSHKDILKNIIKQDLKFPKNNKLTDSAKSFIRKLCEKTTRKRYSAKQALKHKFLNGGSSTKSLAPEVMTQLQSYHKACLLKRVLVKLGTENLKRDRKDLLQEAFNILDSNGDGRITKQELTDFICGYGVSPDLAFKSAEQILADIGSKSSGSENKVVKVNGFREGAVAYDLSIDTTIKKTFKAMTKNSGAKYVSKDDLSGYFHNRVDDKNLEQMLSEIDLDKDGKISFDEFAKAMKCPLKAEHVLSDIRVIAEKQSKGTGSGTKGPGTK